LTEKFYEGIALILGFIAKSLLDLDQFDCAYKRNAVA